MKLKFHRRKEQLIRFNAAETYSSRFENSAITRLVGVSPVNGEYNIPKSLSYLANLDHIPVAIDFMKHISYSNKRRLLRRISPTHGRNMEVDIRPYRNEATLTIDNGVPYSALLLKGANHSDLRIKHEQLNFGLGYYGSAPLEVFRYNLAVANQLRKLGIASERVLMLYKFNEVAMKDSGQVQVVDVKTAKKQMLENARGTENIPESLSGFDEYFNSDESDPAALVRLAGVPWRLEDFTFNVGREVMLYRFSQIFEVTNKRLMLSKIPLERFKLQFTSKNKGDKFSETEQQYVKNQEEIQRYVSYLANFVGSQFGKLHAHEIVHGYAHAGNIDAAGYLMDLDSLSGKPFGNKPQDFETYVRNDISIAYASIAEFAENVGGNILGTLASRENTLMQFMRGYYAAQGLEESTDYNVLNYFTDHLPGNLKRIIVDVISSHNEIDVNPSAKQQRVNIANISNAQSTRLLSKIVN